MAIISVYSGASQSDSSQAVSSQAVSSQAIDAAVHALDSGGIVAVPTDTVYALVADVSYTGAADRLFAMKKRSRDEDLSVLVADVDQAHSLTIGVPEGVEHLMDKFWPGALTIVLPRHPDFVADLGSDDATVGLRCPDNLVARMLCEEFGPLAITTANKQSEQPATTAQQVVDVFGDGVAIVLDGGECANGAATIVDFTGVEPKLLREGSVSWSAIQAVLS